MSKEKVNIRVNISNGEATRMPDDLLERVPKAGSYIQVVQPFPCDEDDVEADEGKESVIMQYAYENIFVKTTAISDDLDEVTINGDYRLPLKGDLTNKKVMVFSDESLAIDKWRTLMNSSLKVIEKRLKKYENMKSNVAEALEQKFH